MKFNMHKASILRKLHSQFPFHSPPAPSESFISLSTNPHLPHTHTRTKQYGFGFGFLLVFFFTALRRTEENYKSPAPLKVGLSHCGRSHRYRKPVIDTRFCIGNKTLVPLRNRRETGDPSHRTHTRGVSPPQPLRNRGDGDGRKLLPGSRPEAPGAAPPRRARLPHLPPPPLPPPGGTRPAPPARLPDNTGPGPLPRALPRGSEASGESEKRVTGTSSPHKERPNRPRPTPGPRRLGRSLSAPLQPSRPGARAAPPSGRPRA